MEELKEELENKGYELKAKQKNDSCYMFLYLCKKMNNNDGWLSYYKTMLGSDYEEYTKHLGSESASGTLIIEADAHAFAVVHGQAHFIARKYCDKDFGLDLAERIVNSQGLTLKHSQTFTSANKKDITSYSQKRKLDDSYEYGEAFSYVKCKTKNKEIWGETADFGESARFTFNKEFSYSAEEIYEFIERIVDALDAGADIKLPRYRRVSDNAVREYLDTELKTKFVHYLTRVETDEYWLTGVSFNFSSDYKCSLKLRGKELLPIVDELSASKVVEVIEENKDIIKDDYESLKVHFYDEDGNHVFAKKLMELMQVTIDYEGKYFVLYENKWVEFSESYIRFIEEKVDSIEFAHKENFGLSEDKLIDKLVKTKGYEKLHRENVRLGNYCIEKADLMDEENVIMIKNQHSTSDLVYLVKQATSSIKLSQSGDLKGNTFSGRNVCLWMLLNRKSLDKLSTLKSFHLLDALNDFRETAISVGLTPVVWVSLNNNAERDKE